MYMKISKNINTANLMISDVFFSEYLLIFGPSVRAQRLSRAASILTFQSGSIRAIRRPRFQVRIPETSILGAPGLKIDQKHRVLLQIRSRPPVSRTRDERRCHRLPRLRTTLSGRRPTADPTNIPPATMKKRRNPSSVLGGWKTGVPKRVVGSWNLKVHRGISNYLVDFTSLFHYMFGKCGRPAQAAQIHEPVPMEKPI